MAFCVTIGSGVAMIPCGNTNAGAPCTRLAVVAASAKTRRKMQVARVANENATSESENVTDEKPPNPEMVEYDDYSKYEEFIRYRDRLRRVRLFFGKYRKWVGYFLQFSWLIGVPVAVIVVLIMALTYKEPPKELTERYNRLYTPQGSRVSQQEEESIGGGFEDTDEYASDVFDFNPTEVAPSLK